VLFSEKLSGKEAEAAIVYNNLFNRFFFQFNLSEQLNYHFCNKYALCLRHFFLNSCESDFDVLYGTSGFIFLDKIMLEKVHNFLWHQPNI
jgi:hypothetical protein